MTGEQRQEIPKGPDSRLIAPKMGELANEVQQAVDAVSTTEQKGEEAGAAVAKIEAELAPNNEQGKRTPPILPMDTPGEDGAVSAPNPYAIPEVGTYRPIAESAPNVTPLKPPVLPPTEPIASPTVQAGGMPDAGKIARISVMTGEGPAPVGSTNHRERKVTTYAQRMSEGAAREAEIDAEVAKKRQQAGIDAPIIDEDTPHIDFSAEPDDVTGEAPLTAEPIVGEAVTKAAPPTLPLDNSNAPTNTPLDRSKAVPEEKLRQRMKRKGE